MNAQFAYLENEVLSASPPKLRLLLIEAALRLSRRIHSPTEEQQAEVTCHALNGLGKIILYLFTSVEKENSPLARQIQGVYGHVYRIVAAARITGDVTEISTVVRLLEIERETWQILTGRYQAEVTADQTRRSNPTGEPRAEETSLVVVAPCHPQSREPGSDTRLSLLA